MASIIPGPMAAVIRGSIGGCTFSRNSVGDYVRNRTKPVYPGTEAQAIRAAQMSQLVEAWQLFSVAERDAWEAKTSSNSITNAVGQQQTPSGFNLYIRANLSLLITFQSTVTIPPTPMIVDAPQLTLVYNDETGIEVTDVHGWAPAYTDALQWSYLTKQRQSIVFHKGPYEKTVRSMGTYIRTPPAMLLPKTICLSDTRNFFRFKVVVDTGAISMAWTQHVDCGTVT